MAPGKFYFSLKGEKYHVQKCTVIDEPVFTRKFEIEVPFNIDNKLVFATPRNFLQIDKIEKQGMEIEPISLID
jgi:hypothetical protein